MEEGGEEGEEGEEGGERGGEERGRGRLGLNIPNRQSLLTAF